jgi:hypothetical protein
MEFSGGQINKSALRLVETSPTVKSGAREMSNWRINATGQLVPRPGRRSLFSSGGRTEYVRMNVGYEFFLSFVPNGITITDLAGNVVAQVNDPTTYMWGAAQLASINWVQAIHDIVICFPGARPQVAHWDAASNTWSFAPFTFYASGGTVYEPFYRFDALGFQMSYSATTGNITLTCQTNFFTDSMIGSVLSILGQQVTITGVTSSTAASGTVSYALPQGITCTVASVAPFQIGQIVNTRAEGISFEVCYIDPTGLTVSGPLTGAAGLEFLSLWTGKDASGGWDNLVSPLGSSAFTAAPTKATVTLATLQWQEEFMSNAKGWPASCFYDRQRLGFCDFPQMPEAIVWGAIGDDNSNAAFWIDSVAAGTQPEAGAAADAAMLEFVADSAGNKVRVRHVIGWGDEFVFTDRGVFQVPISTTSTPLKPGNVEFRQFSNDGCSSIRPVTTQDAIVFINAGLNRCSIVRATGSYSRPFISEDQSDPHSDMFVNPVALAIASGDGEFPERYAYVVRADGVVIVGKFSGSHSSMGWASFQFIGWAPSVSAGLVTWVTTAGGSVYFTAQYGANFLLEAEDASLFLDGCVTLNPPPRNMLQPGAGPFWWWPSATVTLMDQNRDMGDRQTDASGNVVAVQGEDLSSPTLCAGVFSTAVLSPIVPNAPSGATMGQARRKRRIVRAVAHVEDSSGFQLGNRRFDVDNFGVDATAQPVLFDGACRTSPLGRSDDPTIELIKDRPGPLTITELTIEATI